MQFVVVVPLALPSAIVAEGTFATSMPLVVPPLSFAYFQSNLTLIYLTLPRIFAASMSLVVPPLSLVCILVGVRVRGVVMCLVVDVFALVSLTGDGDRLAAFMTFSVSPLSLVRVPVVECHLAVAMSFVAFFRLSFYLSRAYRDPTVPTTQYNGPCHVTSPKATPVCDYPGGPLDEE